MARQLVVAESLAGAYPTLPVTAGTAALTQYVEGADATTAFEAVIAEGKLVILALNTAASAPHTITFTSAVDSYNRTGDITAYSVAAGDVARFGPFKALGWSTGGKLYFTVSDPELTIMALLLP